VVSPSIATVRPTASGDDDDWIEFQPSYWGLRRAAAGCCDRERCVAHAVGSCLSAARLDVGAAPSATRRRSKLFAKKLARWARVAMARVEALGDEVVVSNHQMQRTSSVLACHHFRCGEGTAAMPASAHGGH